MRNLNLFILCFFPGCGFAHIPDIGPSGWIAIAWIFFSQIFLFIYIVCEFSGFIKKLYLIAIHLISFSTVITFFYFMEDVLRLNGVSDFYKTISSVISLVVSFIVPLLSINYCGNRRREQALHSQERDGD